MSPGESQSISPGWRRRAGTELPAFEEKVRMSTWEGTRLEAMLKAVGRDFVIVTGAS